MAFQRRRSRSLADYGSVRGGRDEVSVGAYARAQRRKRLLTGLVGVCLIGGAVWLLFLLRDEGGQSGTFPVLVQCVNPECGYRGVVQLEMGQSDEPLTCPKCGQRSARKVWECRTCRKQFLKKAGEDIVRCPYCGSESVGTAVEPVER